MCEMRGLTCWYFCLQGLGTDEETLIEIVCSRSNEELVDIKKVYKDSKFGNLVPTIINKCEIKNLTHKQ